MPTNGEIHFEGYGLSLSGVSVTVNGNPASLVEVPSRGVGSKAARVTPEPAVNAEVILSGTFCEAADNCDAHTLIFSAIPADSTPPAVPVLTVNLHDHADTSAGVGSCVGDAAATLWFHLQGTPAAAGEALVVHVVEVADGVDFGTPFRTTARLVNAADQVMSVRLEPGVVMGELGGRFCYRAFDVDYAGNQSAYSPVTCAVCHARAESGDAGMFSSPPEEPQWMGADVVAGGPCDVGGASSSAGPSSAAMASGSSATTASSAVSTASSTAASAGTADGGVGVAGDSGCACNQSGAGQCGFLLGLLLLNTLRLRVRHPSPL